jgi:predicted porin
MQKKLIAMAVAGLVSGAAFAQSNVTIYGVMDATYDNVSATGATQGSGYNYESRGRTTFNSSYIGFKGSESIGNGLTAVFQIETGVGEDATGSFGSLTGTSSTSVLSGSTYGWANRDTMVALAGGFGTVAFGNITGPTRLLGCVMDPNAGATGIGANTALLGKMGGGSGAGVFDQRIANAIAYISPTFSGFYGVIGYLPNENRSTNVTADTNISAWTLGGVYGNGPILAGLTWTKAKDDGEAGISYANATTNALTDALLGTVVTPQLSDTSDLRAAFKYDFGVATVGIMWDRMKANLIGAQATALGFTELKRDVWYIPVTVKLGPGKLVGQAQGRWHDC